MKIIKETEIKNINSILNKFWENSNKKIKKPNMKIILFYAQEKENILGFAYCYDLNDGYFHELILDDLFIKKEFRKKQIGTELIKEIIKYSKKNKIEKIKLDLETKNKVAKKLYKKMEFKKIKNISRMEKII